MIKLIDVTKSYPIDKIKKLQILKGITLNIDQSEFVSIMGSSGSGKTTLLNIIGCLDSLSTGNYHFLEKNVVNLHTKKTAIIRRQHIGFVFQSFSLIPKLSAFRNIELPMIYAGVPSKKRKLRVYRALEKVNLQNRAEHKPSQLSGGQQQRVAIARALVNKPALLVADEPTGSLDTDTGIEIMNLFQQLNDEGMTIVMVTHDMEVAAFSKRIIRLRDGRIVNTV